MPTRAEWDDMPLVYLASPRLRQPGDPLEATTLRVTRALQVEGALVTRGLRVFNPLRYTELADDVSADESYWRSVFMSMMRACDVLAVITIDNAWRTSSGVQDEMALARYLEHPIVQVKSMSECELDRAAAQLRGDV